MTEGKNHKLVALEQRIRVLEEENAQLAERAEDSLLFGLISGSIQNLPEKLDVFENTLEQIAILKALPYASCGTIDGTQIAPMSIYCLFSDEPDIGFPITLSEEAIDQLAYGPVILNHNQGVECHFDDAIFRPQRIALIPFEAQNWPDGVFVFIDDTKEENRLASIISLLNQVIERAVDRYDNMYLIEALTHTNRDLESRVALRTKELTRVNESLVREMSERKISEQALSKSHQTFVTVLNSIDATVNVVDLKSHRILFMNKHMIDVYGRDLTGEFCFEAFREKSAPCKSCTHAQLLDETGKPADVVIWQGKNPVTGRWYVNYDRAIQWIDGRKVRLQIATDITQFKNMEAKLQQAQKMEAIGTLAGGIAHDFNNLLMAIQGHASLMAVELNPAHPSMEHIHSIEEHIRSAMDLTKQLLGFALGGKYEVKPIDINELVVDSATMFGRTKKEIRIHTKVCNRPLVLEVDRRQMEQVLLNLFINAWQAMPGGGQLSINTRRIELDEIYCRPHQVQPGAFGLISITDTGSGMDDQTRQQIFDPFFTTKEIGRGTGLGLASAYGIVKNHGGIITVYSEVGHGTTFNIYLPTSTKEAHRDTPLEGRLIKGSETILLVDDETMILKVGQAILAKLGYRVIVAKGGEEAIREMRKRGKEIDLVILDLIMPDMDGSATFDRLRALQPNLPVLLSSGYAINGQANEIMQRGCNGFIQKPFNISEISEHLRKILDTPSSTG